MTGQTASRCDLPVGTIVRELADDDSVEIATAAKGVVLSAIEEQAVLLMHDQLDRLRDPDDYAGRFVAALLDIRRELGQEWGWPDPRLPRWFNASDREDG